MNAPGTGCDGGVVILPSVGLPERANRRFQYSGIDSPEQCFNKQHFRTYPHNVDYQFNSRGFRDAEWLDDLSELSQCTWCVGDSFTVGIGQPYAHIWPQVLSKKSGIRTINVSMDGASNDWISRQCQHIMQAINPLRLVVMWSYTHRREHGDPARSDIDRRIFSSRDTQDQDWKHWISVMQQLTERARHHGCDLIQCTIPDFHHDIINVWDGVKDDSWGECPRNRAEFEALPDRIAKELRDLHGCYDRMRVFFARQESRHIDADIIHVSQRLDWARDHHHFDVMTSEWLVQRILAKIRGDTDARNHFLLVSADRSD